MGIRLKFNLILIAVFLGGFGIAGGISHELLTHNARQEILRNARLMMETSLAIRGYTPTTNGSAAVAGLGGSFGYYTLAE